MTEEEICTEVFLYTRVAEYLSKPTNTNFLAARDAYSTHGWMAYQTSEGLLLDLKNGGVKNWQAIFTYLKSIKDPRMVNVIACLSEFAPKEVTQKFSH